MNNIKLVEQSENHVITKTYKLEIDGTIYHWLEYLDRKGKMIDCQFRDESGNEIGMDYEKQKRVMDFLDGLENKG